MNKKLGRLIQPGMGLYFLLMFAFAIADFFFSNTLLACIEAGLALLLLIYSQARKFQRRKEIAAYIQSATDTLDIATKANMPFPMALIRLGDGEIIWCNEKFYKVSGLKDSMLEQQITDVFPSFTTDWLAAGKGECPYDVSVGGRRYRVYGTTIHADDPDGTLLGTLYLSDLTELYQVRDEYIRSRPVVCLILIDNY